MADCSRICNSLEVANMTSEAFDTLERAKTNTEGLKTAVSSFAGESTTAFNALKDAIEESLDC